MPAYVIAQVIGATIGAFAIAGVLGKEATDLGLGVASFNSDAVSYARAIFAEGMGTFLLVFVVFGVIDRRAPAGWAGLAIGFVVFAAIIVVAPATAASINPARTFGPMVALQIFGGSVLWSQLPAYLIGEFVGGTLAGLAYIAISREASGIEEIPEYPLKEALTDDSITAPQTT